LEEHPKPDKASFANWLFVQLNTDEPDPELFETESVEADNFMFLANMNRFAKGYVKLALEDSVLRSAEEFAVLINLKVDGPQSKAELIREAILEFSVGAEMIKRLIKQELIAEKQDTVDKRRRIVSITQAGEAELFSVLSELRKVAQMVNGPLSLKEKSMLHFLLRKLRMFHWEVRNDQQHDSLESMIQKNLSPKREADS